MNTRCLAFALATALAAALTLPAARAQTIAPPPPAADAAASAPLNLKPDTKRNQSPTEGRNSAPSGGDLRPDRRAVTPQISIPLNTKAGQPPPKAVLTPAPRAGTPAPTGGIDDSAARCGALADATAREQCLSKLPR